MSTFDLLEMPLITLFLQTSSAGLSVFSAFRPNPLIASGFQNPLQLAMMRIAALLPHLRTVGFLDVDARLSRI
jgi:hypothetical protein